MQAEPWMAVRDVPDSVMIVEDDSDMRRLLEIVLNRNDRLSRDLSFDNASDALGEILSGVCPAAILCDAGLPGMSGLRAVPLFREACPNAVIVIYTANPEGCSDAVTRGADAVMSKATLPTQVVEHVAELLEQRTTS